MFVCLPHKQITSTKIRDKTFIILPVDRCTKVSSSKIKLFHRRGAGTRSPPPSKIFSSSASSRLSVAWGARVVEPRDAAFLSRYSVFFSSSYLFLSILLIIIITESQLAKTRRPRRRLVVKIEKANRREKEEEEATQNVRSFSEKR